MLLLGFLILSGCSSRARATGYCASVRRSDARFDSSEPNKARAIAAFDRVSKSAPTVLAPDLRTISAFMHAYQHDPTAATRDPATTSAYLAASARVDRYLAQTCGVPIPAPADFGSSSSTTVAP